MATALVMTSGCDSDDALPDPVPSASASATPARYTEVDGGCPTFNGAAAERYGASGRGQPDVSSSAPAIPGLTTIDCQWAPAAARPSVSVSFSLYPNGFAPGGDGAANARHFYDGLRADADKDAANPTSHVVVGDETSASGPAFAVAYAPTDSVTYAVLADNAVVTVVVRDRGTDGGDLDVLARELLRRVGPAAGVLAVQAVASLR
jgi:hypothetical protein